MSISSGLRLIQLLQCLAFEQLHRDECASIYFINFVNPQQAAIGFSRSYLGAWNALLFAVVMAGQRAVINVTDLRWWRAHIETSRKGRHFMLALPHFLYALAAFYVALGIEVAHRGLKPSCRECLYRHCCPNRQQSGVPPCLRRYAPI